MREFKTLLFNIPGNPKSKGRPRFYMRRAYTPATTKKEQRRLREAIRKQIEEHPDYQLNYPVDKPVSIDLIYHIKRPQSLNLKRCPDKLIPHSKRPDVDNLAKLTIDAMDEILVDDALIIKLCLAKFYCSKTGPNSQPKTIIRMEFLDG